ncbi:hypothetical protein A3759_17995 [Thalassolituus sp. HI0120]|nr:hypothetical protein A3759_19810 [Thalassolituus sp. HI0120]KZZ48299.1 hypothetical protein A3759_17995 [Thalassolituus sp. HI0120]
MAAQCATEVDDNPLWNFALAFYASKDAQQCLLTLQDTCQQDTLLVLTALWLASDGESWQLTDGQLEDYRRWRKQVIWSLRTARKAITKDSELPGQQALRQQIQKDEIRAEQIALHQLYGLHSSTHQKQQSETIDRQQTLNNLFKQAELGQPESGHTAATKKEALEPLFKQLADLLVSQ